MDLTSTKLTNYHASIIGSTYNIIDSNIFQLGQFKPSSLKYNPQLRLIFVEKSPYNFSATNAVEMLSDIRNDFYKKFSDSIHLPKPKLHSCFKLTVMHPCAIFENDSYNVNQYMLASIFRTCTTEISVRLNKLFIFEDNFILNFSVVSIIIMEIAPYLAEMIKTKNAETISIKKHSKNDIKTDIKKIFNI